VKELANTLDYEPNVNAVNLRTSKNNLFGLIVPSISNFFYDSFISAVEEESRKTNYSLMILQSGDDVQIENDNIKLCRQSRICGLFVCISKHTKDLEPYLKLKGLDIPVIFFDKVPDLEDCNKVCVADVSSATIAANAINKKAKQHVLAIFGNTQLSITKKRLAAFTTTLNGNTQLQIHHANNTTEAEQITASALKTKPDTIFCMSDEILVGALKAIQKAALKIPDDINIIGISNGFIPTLYHPEITYVETSGYKLGKLAFSSMMACMAGSSFVQDLTIESILVEGGSLT
jgi:LacI family transcriptional regulator